VSADLDSARRDWENGYRALLATGDRLQRDRLYEQVDVVTAELRKRIGSTFTLSELAELYASAEDWVRAAVAEHASAPGWSRTVAASGDAAFHLYARGAQDYEP